MKSNTLTYTLPSWGNGSPRLQIDVPSSFSMKQHEGPDFDVYYFSDSSTKSSMGLYVGHHPSLHSRETGVIDVHRQTDRVGDVSVEWQRWTADDRHRSETLVHDLFGKSAPIEYSGLVLHVFTSLSCSPAPQSVLPVALLPTVSSFHGLIGGAGLFPYLLYSSLLLPLSIPLKPESLPLGEDINKANFRATIERIVGKNNYGIVVNGSQIDKLNFCPNPYSDLEENDDIIRDEQIIADAIEKKIKRDTVPRLVKLGLTTEQIAEVLELSISEVQKIVASQGDRT